MVGNHAMKIVGILQNRGPRFILRGYSRKTFNGKSSIQITWKIFSGISSGQKHEKLHGDSIKFHVEYCPRRITMETFSIAIPLERKHMKAP